MLTDVAAAKLLVESRSLSKASPAQALQQTLEVLVACQLWLERANY